jgi:hypothetical protein
LVFVSALQARLETALSPVADLALSTMSIQRTTADEVEQRRQERLWQLLRENRLDCQSMIEDARREERTEPGLALAEAWAKKTRRRP